MHRTDHVEVVAYDPGGTTGWAVISLQVEALLPGGPSLKSSLNHFASGEIKGDQDDQCNELMHLANSWPYAAIVGESFVIRQFNQSKEFISPIQINAIIRHSLTLKEKGTSPIKRPPRKLFFQDPATAKSTVPDNVLKLYGAWHTNSPHARDAGRHAITFLRRSAGGGKGSILLRAQAWPHIFGLPEEREEVA